MGERETSDRYHHFHGHYGLYAWWGFPSGIIYFDFSVCLLAFWSRPLGACVKRQHEKKRTEPDPDDPVGFQLPVQPGGGALNTPARGYLALFVTISSLLPLGSGYLKTTQMNAAERFARACDLRNQVRKFIQHPTPNALYKNGSSSWNVLRIKLLVLSLFCVLICACIEESMQMDWIHLNFIFNIS